MDKTKELSFDELEEVAGGAVGKDTIETNAVIVEQLDSGKYTVEIDNGIQLECSISGKLRTSGVSINKGDEVVVEIPLYNPKIGRILERID